MKKSIYALIIIAACISAWNVVVYQKKKMLASVVEPFQAACQTAPGCLLGPAGWRHGSGNVYLKDSMEYTATFDRFEVSWHIGPDVQLIAKGGKNRPLEVERVVN